MTVLGDALQDVARELRGAGRNFALVGGLAVSVRTQPRFTRDIDLAVSVDGDEDAEDTVRALAASGYRVLAVIEQEATGRLATVRTLPPGQDPEGIVVDVLFASSGVEPEVVASAEAIEVLPDVVVPVASVGHLIALKVLSHNDRRPQDAADLVGLLAAATAADRAVARGAAALITTRGYARGRDLVADLAALSGSVP